MKKLYILLSVSALMLMPINADAQGFLKGLKEKAEKGISGALGSFLGEEAPQEAPQQNYNQSSTQQTPPRQRAASNLAPSTAVDARALYAEFPSFPTASQAANLDVRDQYDDKLTVLKKRIEELKDAIPMSMEEQMQMANNYKDEYTAQQMGMSVEEYREMMADNQRNMAAGNAFFGGLEMTALQNSAELERIANSMDMEKMDAIEAEMEKLEKKKNRSAAEQKRLEELQAEYMELASPMINLMGGMDAVMAAGEKAEEVKAATPKQEVKKRNDFDLEYQAFSDSFDKLQASVRNSQRTSNIESQINYSFQKIWAEPAASSNVRALYSELFDYIDAHGGNAEARVRLGTVTYNEVKTLLEKAFYFADNSSKTEYYAKSQMLRAPYNVLELLAEVYEGVFDANTLVYNPVKTIKIDFGIKENASEYLYVSESFYNLMDASNVSLSKVSATDDFGEVFKCKATFLLYNHREGRFYSLKCGQRTPLTVKDGQKIDFSKPLNTAGLRTETITMDSADKKITLTKDGTLELPGENYYFPVAIRCTNEWLEFITMSGSEFYLNRFRL